METYRDIYERFKKNYKNSTGGINIYPQFDSDLELLLEYFDNDDVMGDLGIDGTWLPDLEVDCNWGKPED